MEPLVSCILLARGRPEMTAASVACWKAQAYPNTELLILDDADCPAFPKGFRASNWPDAESSGEPRVAYFSLPKRLTVGTKRNLGCELAHGEFVAHWDSDDWSAPDRLIDQMTWLLSSRLSVTGYHTMLFTDGAQWWRFDGPRFQEGMGAFGTSFLYRKAWCLDHPFIDGPKRRIDSEDNPFVREAMKSKQFIGVPCGEMMVARVHPDNTSPKCPSGMLWVPITAPESLREAVS